jgi:predicted nucleotidyltransferase
MPQQELLRQVVDVLKRAGVPYMVTGSLVSSLQGEPRATHDIDVVVQIDPASVPQIVRAFPPPDYYLDEISVREALARQDMFNLLDIVNGDKVDFWLLTKDPFDVARFGRRIPEELEGLTLYVSRPEDTILQKLRWAEMSGGSEKQFRDAVGVYEVQLAGLDTSYIDRWAGQLGVSPLWERLRAEAKPPATGH